jgi:hypothetical protein
MASMEFSFRVSEAEYLMAWKLRGKSTGSRNMTRIVFWAFILVCLVLLWVVVQRKSSSPLRTEEPAATQRPAPALQSSDTTVHALLVNIGPIIVISGFWAFVFTRRGSAAMRRKYRKDPMMQGQFTVEITSESISGRNTAGNSWKNEWNMYASWVESKDLIVLMYFTGAYFVLSIAGLSDAQRSELRGILAAALPKK